MEQTTARHTVRATRKRQEALIYATLGPGRHVRIQRDALARPADRRMLQRSHEARTALQARQEQLPFRGATEQEVNEAIRTSPWQPAELGRLECRRNFVFQQEWNGAWYPTKQVRPIFVDEPEEIVVVTVYVYYLREER